MKNNLHYTPAARRDMDAIWDHIVIELSNLTAAQRTIDRIMDAVDLLADFPEMGAALAVKTDTTCNYRFLVTGSYLTFYRVCGGDIYIDRVIHGRRDYLQALFGDPADQPEGSDADLP